MVAHAENHRNDGYVKLYSLKNSTNPIYRPEEHVFNHTTGMYYGGSDTKLDRIILPSSVPFSSDEIACRTCGKFKLPFSHSLSMKSQGRAIARMKKHEQHCKIKK